MILRVYDWEGWAELVTVTARNNSYGSIDLVRQIWIEPGVCARYKQDIIYTNVSKETALETLIDLKEHAEQLGFKATLALPA